MTPIVNGSGSQFWHHSHAASGSIPAGDHGVELFGDHLDAYGVAQLAGHVADEDRRGDLEVDDVAPVVPAVDLLDDAGPDELGVERQPVPLHAPPNRARRMKMT